MSSIQHLYDDLPEPFCGCCQFGDHNGPCTCKGVHTCCHPQAHFRGNRPNRRTFPELAGPAEAAVILDVSRQRVGQLELHALFPAPVARLRCGPIFLADEIAHFQARRDRTPGRRRG